MYDPPKRLMLDPLLATPGLRTATLTRGRNSVVYVQGDSADALYYVRCGHVKLTALSGGGKEAVITIVGPRDFFGETCLADQATRTSSATTLTHSVFIRIAKREMIQVLHSQPSLSALFLSYVLSRNLQMEAELVDQLCNCCEQRLARILLRLSNVGDHGPAAILRNVNQETLAAMVGTTRPRISFLLNKFRKQGLIEYGENLQVNRSLLAQVVLRERKFLAHSATA